MTRILLSLSIFSLSLVAAALILGLSVGDLYASPPSQETLITASVHRLTGLSAALVVVFVESLVVTYFIGTSRWCKEVVETYGFPPAAARESVRLKRRTFPIAVAGMLTVVAMSALGAAGDRGNGFAGAHHLVIVHLIAALGGFAFIAWTYYAAWNNVHQNQRVIEQIVADVARVRHERGLDDAESSAFDRSLPERGSTQHRRPVAG